VRPLPNILEKKEKNLFWNELDIPRLICSCSLPKRKINAPKQGAIFCLQNNGNLQAHKNIFDKATFVFLIFYLY